MAVGQLRWPPAILFYRCSLDLSILFFRRLISEVAWPIVTKHCCMFDGVSDLSNSVRNVDGLSPSPEIWWPKNIKISVRDFAQLRDSIANISGTQQDIVGKTALQTTDTVCRVR